MNLIVKLVNWDSFCQGSKVQIKAALFYCGFLTNIGMCFTLTCDFPTQFSIIHHGF